MFSLKEFQKRTTQQTKIIHYLIQEHFPEGTRVSNPTGGYAHRVKLPPGTAAILLFQLRFKRVIDIIPGHIFASKERLKNCIAS